MCGCECYISAKHIHSSLISWCYFYFKKSRIKSKMIKTEGLGGKKIAYMEHIKIQSFQMGVIFTPKHLIWQRQQCVNIHSQIMRYHTVNVYFGVVSKVQSYILFTKKQMINIPTKYHQFVFTFIIYLHVVQHMEVFC